MTYIIAEVGGNHDGNVQEAINLVVEAAHSGADAVKFQIYDADKLVTKKLPAFTQATGYKYQRNRFKDLEFKEEEWLEIVRICREVNVDFMATCFDIETLDKYQEYMDMIKIASGDLTYKKLIERASSYQKPIILSTGMASFEEIQMVSKWVHPGQLTLLHCVSCYPCADINVNFPQMQKLMAFYNRVGYSDHTFGTTACMTAAALGAKVIEKHFTIDNAKTYGDHMHSITPIEMRDMVGHIRRMDRMFGTEVKPFECESEIHRFRRGGYAARDMKKGDVIKDSDVLAIRPTTKKMPHEYVGETLTKNIKKGFPLDG